MTDYDDGLELYIELENMKQQFDILKQLLKEALPHVEQMANVLATGPIAGPVEHLADDIRTAILETEK